jgi:hypothetical protein
MFEKVATLVTASMILISVSQPSQATTFQDKNLGCVFRGHPASDSESIRPPIPILSGQ